MKRIAVFVVLVLFSGGAHGKNLLSNGHAIAAAHKECVREVGRPFPQYAKAIFSDHRLRFVVVEHDMTMAEYRQRMLSPQSIDTGASIAVSFQKHLSAARRKYGVLQEDIIAIFRGESNFGYETGRTSVVNALYSKCISNPKKRKFATRELREFLGLALKHGWDAHDIRGSRDGAFGYVQFLPTSFSAYAVDGDGDGKIDLFSYPDAIASAANYLSKHGYMHWSRENRKLAFFRYNNSTAYSNALLEYAERTIRLFYAKTSSKKRSLS